MANKKSAAVSHSLSTIKLTKLDKLALVADLLPDQCEEVERQIVNYALELTASPIMLRYLRDAIEGIAQEERLGDDNGGATALAMRLAELHFAANVSLAC